MTRSMARVGNITKYISLHRIPEYYFNIVSNGFNASFLTGKDCGTLHICPTT